MRIPRLLATAGLLIATVLPAGAQQNAPQRTPASGGADGSMPGMPGHGMMGGMRGPGMMMGRGGSPAAMLAHMKTPLNLSDDQVKRLEALAATQKAALQPNEGAMLRARADLADARKGEGDLPLTRKALEKLAALRVDGAIAHLKAMQEARAILTAEQRDKLPTMRGRMGGRGFHGGHAGAGAHHGWGGPGGGQGQMRMHEGGPGQMGPGRPGAEDDNNDLDDDEMMLFDDMDPTR